MNEDEIEYEKACVLYVVDGAGERGLTRDEIIARVLALTPAQEAEAWLLWLARR